MTDSDNPHDLPLYEGSTKIETFTFDDDIEEEDSDLATVLARGRDRLTKLVPLAIDTISMLALSAERENVQLAAAESILDRTGLSRGSSVLITTSKQEHELATKEATALVEKLERNRALMAAPVLPHTPALDTLAVLEGDVITLPQEGAVPGVVIDTTATE